MLQGQRIFKNGHNFWGDVGLSHTNITTFLVDNKKFVKVNFVIPGHLPGVRTMLHFDDFLNYESQFFDPTILVR